MEGGQQESDYLNQVLVDYEPCQTDLFVTLKDGNYQRLIFGEPQDLLQEELDKWEAFEDYVEEKKLPAVPSFFSSSER